MLDARIKKIESKAFGDTSHGTGLFEGVTNDDYHALKGALSSSRLKDLDESAFHFHMNESKEFEATDAMDLGTAVHAGCLEPELFKRKYVRLPEGLKLSTTEGKARHAMLLSENPGAELLKADVYDKAQSMIKNIMEHKIAGRLLDPRLGKAELSALAFDRDTELLLKCRPDFLRNDGIVIDIKTTSKGAGPFSFQREMKDRNYNLQAAFYLRVLSQVFDRELTSFVFIVVESTFPFAVAVYAMSPEALEQSKANVERLLQLYCQCKKTDVWPGFSDEEILSLDLPKWAQL